MLLVEKCSQESVDHTLKITWLLITQILVPKIAGMLFFIETLTCILSLPPNLCFTKGLTVVLGKMKEHSFENGRS